MGFKQNAYAKLWFVDRKERYSVAYVTISKKDKVGVYTTEFSCSYVKLIGEAHNKARNLNLPTKEEFNKGRMPKGITIRITNCDVSNNVDATTKQVYFNPIIYDFDIVDRNTFNNKSNI